MKKIESLTEEQKALFPKFIEEWTNIGLSTEPADRPRAEAAVKWMYNQAGLKKPKIVWTGSPLSSGLTRSIISSEEFQKKFKKEIGQKVWDSVGASVGASVGDSVRASVWASVGASVGDSVGDSVWDSVGDSVGASVGDSVGDSVGASVGDSVGDSVGASVWDSVRASVGASVWDSVWDSVRDSVGDSVGASVGDSVRDSVGDSVWDSVRDSVYGQHDANWLAFYFYFHEVLHLKDQTGKLNGLWELCRSSGWILPHENICWMSERHNILNRDTRGRLHSTSAAALEYPDGWKIYAVHGVRVPEDVITDPKTITAERIEKETNVEIKRVMIQNYIGGQSKWLMDSGANLIHECADINSGLPLKLWKKERNGDTPIVMVEMLNKTLEPDDDGHLYRKSYFIRVKPDIQDALEACAWHQNQTKASYLKTQMGT